MSSFRIQRQLKRNNNYRLTIRRVRKGNERIFLSLIDALADYEKLKRPDTHARKRLTRDGFGRKKRFDGYLAFFRKKAIGYAIIFETYSSFLARPTLYLEDFFILSDYRSKGFGREFFKFCLKEARSRNCGRMEWAVLNWNKSAIRFYEKLGARQLTEWLTFRLERKQFGKILSS